MDNNISIRRATVDDAEIIAKVVAMAIGDKSALESYCGKDYHSVLTTIAQQQDTQYSYKFALIAQIGIMMLSPIASFRYSWPFYLLLPLTFIGIWGNKALDRREGKDVFMRPEDINETCKN